MLMQLMVSALLVLLPLSVESDKPKSAQASVGLARSEPEAQYRLIKRHLATEVEKRLNTPDLTEGKYDLFNCYNPGAFTGEIESSRPMELADYFEGLALDGLVWQHDLKLLRYPREAWIDLIAQYEKDTLAWLQADEARRHEDLVSALEHRRVEFMEKLSASLNASRVKNQSLPPVSIEGGCGDGGIAVKISTRPNGGRVWLIPRFYFDLCKAQGLDQKSIEQCDRWMEIIPGEEMMLTGNYKYIVQWPDGTTKLSDYSAPKSEEGNLHFIIRK